MTWSYSGWAWPEYGQPGQSRPVRPSWPEVRYNLDHATAPAVPAAVAPAVPAAVAQNVVAVLAAAELAAFIADLDAMDMNGHNNVFMRNGIEVVLEEYEGGEGNEVEEEEVDKDDDEEDWSDDEFDDADFADV